MKTFCARLAVLAALLLAPLALRAQVAGTLDAGFNPNATGGNSVLAAAVQPDGKIVIGGFFTTVGGVPRNRIARLNADGSVETNFDPGTGVNGFVVALAVQADGKILIAGGFSFVNGQPRNNIARLNADGTVESAATFNPGTGANGEVQGMAVQPNGKILIVGRFTAVNGLVRNGIARLNADGSVEGTATFNPGTGAPGQVWCVAVQLDGKILLGGPFTTVNGQTRNHIARLNADGTVESTATFNPGTGANDHVYSVAVQPDGKIVLGGSFTTVNGQARNRIARLNANGTLEGTATFNPGTGATNGVFSVVLQTDGKILIAGQFLAVNGQLRSRIARLAANGSVEATATFDPGTGGNDNIFCVALQADGKILLGGEFTTINGQTRNHIARLANDAATQALTTPSGSRVRWSRGGAAPEADAVTFELSIDSGENWTLLGAGTRIAGGWERTGLGLPASGSIRARARSVGGLQSGSAGLIEQIAAFNLPAGSVDAGFIPSVSLFPHGLAVQPDGKIAIANHAAAVFPEYCFRMNTNGTLDQVFSPSANDRANCAAIQSDGKVIFGGDFTSPGFHVTRYNATGTLDTAFPASANLVVYWTAIQPDGKIVIGGGFNTVNGESRFEVARLNADGTLDTSFGNPRALAATRSGVAQPDGKIIIGGAFDSVGGVARNFIARLNANGTLDTAFNPNANGPVDAVLLQPDGRIVIAGEFTAVGGVTRNRIARVNANGTLDTGFNPNLNDLVQSTALQADGKIIVGGWFTRVGDVARMSLARLNTNGSLDTTFGAVDMDGVLVSVALQGDGKILMGGNFSNVNGMTRGSFARLLNGPAVQSLTVPATNRVRWLRGGTAPQTHAVTFELSTDGGENWILLGAGTRTDGGWERTGLSLPASGTIRARARIAGGYYNGSSGLVEQVQAFALDIAPPTLSPVTISSSNPNPLFAKLGDTITLSFTASEPIQTPVVTLAGQSAAVTNPGGNNWRGTVVVAAPSPQGLVGFSIAATDLIGNAAAAVTATTNGSSVTIDRTPPVLTLLGANPLLVAVSTAYVEPGATASDAQAGNLTAFIQISGAVNTNVIGTYTRTYMVADNAGNATTTTRTVRVVDQPVAGMDTLGTMKNTPVSAPAVKLLANDSDPNGHPLSVVSVSLASANGGTVALGGGLLTYTPPAGFMGLDSFTYTISDGFGGTATGTVNVTVSGADGASLNQVSMTRTADGFLVSFAGIPGDTYLIQFADSLTPPVTWMTLTPPGPIQAGPNGLFQFEDKPNPIPPQRFYRAAIPQ